MRKLKFSSIACATLVSLCLVSCSKNNEIDNTIVDQSITFEQLCADIDNSNTNSLECRSESLIAEESLYLESLELGSQFQYVKQSRSVSSRTKYANSDKLYTECFNESDISLVPTDNHYQTVHYVSNIYELRFFDENDIKIIYKIYKDSVVSSVYGALYKGPNTQQLVSSLFDLGQNFDTSEITDGTIQFGLNIKGELICIQDKIESDVTMFLSEINQSIICSRITQNIYKFSEQEKVGIMITAIKSNEKYFYERDAENKVLLLERNTLNNYLYKSLGLFNENKIPQIDNYIVQNNY
ncbi:MAG: hypothetical protein WC366_02530 [Bacilli bacterium]|jgi:hypothetical protein